MKIIQQTIRGCGTLPHVGDHPGTMMLFVFVLIGALAGSKSSWTGMIGGSIFMLVIFAPIYLFGAYDRANLSDLIEGKNKC
jgi:hypothetical protein